MKWIFLFICLVLFIGCEIWDNDPDYHNSHSDYDPDYEIDNVYLHDILISYDIICWPGKINTYIYDYIIYKHDSGDNWQSPSETHYKLTGDCEDYALYVAYFIHRYTRLKPNLLRIENKYGNGHFVCNIYNFYFGIQTSHNTDGSIKFPSTYSNENGDLNITDIYNYGTAMYYSEYIK